MRHAGACALSVKDRDQRRSGSRHALTCGRLCASPKQDAVQLPYGQPFSEPLRGLESFAFSRRRARSRGPRRLKGTTPPRPTLKTARRLLGASLLLSAWLKSSRTDESNERVSHWLDKMRAYALLTAPSTFASEKSSAVGGASARLPRPPSSSSREPIVLRALVQVGATRPKCR